MNKRIIRIDMNIFKRYCNLMKDILSFKAIDENGKKQYTFYLFGDYDDELSSKELAEFDLHEMNLPVNEKLNKYLIPRIMNEDEYNDSDYTELSLNNSFYDKEYLGPSISGNIINTFKGHTYYFYNFIERNRVINLPDAYLKFLNDNKEALNKLSDEIDDYNLWLYNYKKNNYFNNNYEIIHKFNEDKLVNEELRKLLKKMYNKDKLNYAFYSYANSDHYYSALNELDLDNRISFGIKIDRYANTKFDKNELIATGDYNDMNLPYKLHSIVKNNDDNNIRLLFNVGKEFYDKSYCYEDGLSLFEGTFNDNDDIVAELVFYDDEDLYKRLNNE